MGKKVTEKLKTSKKSGLTREEQEAINKKKLSDLKLKRKKESDLATKKSIAKRIAKEGYLTNPDYDAQKKESAELEDKISKSIASRRSAAAEKESKIARIEKLHPNSKQVQKKVHEEYYKAMNDAETEKEKTLADAKESGKRVPGELPSECTYYAAFAKAAYGRHDAEKAERLPYKDWQLNDQLTIDEFAVWYRDKTVLCAPRGSTTIEDWLDTDKAIAMGLEEFSERWSRNKRQFEKVIAAYPNRKMILVGHSLGGSLALDLTHHYKSAIDAVYVYNSGSGAGEYYDRMSNKLRDQFEPTLSTPKNYHAYFIKGDVLSFMGSLDTTDYKVHVYEPLSRSYLKALRHSIDQFLQ